MLVTFKPGTFGGKGEDWELASLGIFAKGSFWTSKVMIGCAASFDDLCLYLPAEAGRRESKYIKKLLPL